MNPKGREEPLMDTNGHEVEKIQKLQTPSTRGAPILKLQTGGVPFWLGIWCFPGAWSLDLSRNIQFHWGARPPRALPSGALTGWLRRSRPHQKVTQFEVCLTFDDAFSLDLCSVRLLLFNRIVQA